VVEFGSRGDMEARKWARRLPDFTVASHETAAEALATVAAGEADGALVDHVSALAEIGAGSGLVVVGDPIVAEPYAVGTRQESVHLLRAINDALAEMEADGTIEALVAEWLKR
jgi:ABC-type amino acid transport substrate-binding protein